MATRIVQLRDKKPFFPSALPHRNSILPSPWQEHSTVDLRDASCHSWFTSHRRQTQSLREIHEFHLWIILRTYIYVVCTNGQYCSFKNGTMYSSMKTRKVSNVETTLGKVMDNYGGYCSLRSETMIVSFPS